MDTDHSLNMSVSKLSEAHPETMDFLSNAWCNFAVQALQPELSSDVGSSILVQDNTMKSFDLNMEKCSPRMEDADYTKSVPQWKSNDLKSWIWMQQVMHPELNYNGFRKKWFEWKMPFGNVSIKKWVKEIKEKRKEGKRLQRAEVYAALSIAGLATALAAIAEESSKGQLEHESSPARKAALASATAVVASQCAQVAESIGAKREQLSTIISSAMSGTSTSDIFTLTAAATASLRGAATLKARSGCKNRNGEPVLPIDVDNCKLDEDLDFVKSRATLSKGAELTIEIANGKSMVRIVAINLNNEAKVILRIMKRNFLNVITNKKDCLVLDLHAELYKDEGGEEFDNCYQIVLTTTRRPIKIDMADDYQRYKMWVTTISRMLKIPPTLTKYELQFCKY